MKPVLILATSGIGIFLASNGIMALKQAQGASPDSPPVSQVGLTRMPPFIQQIRTQEDFNAVLKKDRAIVFIWVPWSVYVREFEKLLKQWLREQDLLATVYRVDLNAHPFVQQWLNGQEKDYLGFTGGGELVWLRQGAIVAEQICPYQKTRSDLQQKTISAFMPIP